MIEGEVLVLLSTGRRHRAGGGRVEWSTYCFFLGAQCLQEGKLGGSSPEGREKEELGPALRAFGVGGVREDGA